MEYDSAMMYWLAYHDPAEALRMLERAFPDYWQKWDQSSRFDFFRVCWVLCHRLAERDTPLRLELPKEVPLWNPDGNYAASALADWFYTNASEIAQAFKKRDGYPFFQQKLETISRVFGSE